MVKSYHKALMVLINLTFLIDGSLGMATLVSYGFRNL